jgi:FMN phosphatase YigB (HAD superfamily)
VQLPPERCLFVDDLEKNVVGAHAVHMDAVRFEGEAPLRLALRARGIL